MTDRPDNIKIRFTLEEDAPLLKRWLSDPQILRWFPMCDEREIDDAVRIWVSYSKIQACLTALWDGVPCGMANLYIQSFKKLSHTCLLSIIVDERFRGKGVGKALLEELAILAKEKFHIEILHLEVYEGNPARRLYERMGFIYYGIHKRFIKERGEYLSKVFMQKELP